MARKRGLLLLLAGSVLALTSPSTVAPRAIAHEVQPDTTLPSFTLYMSPYGSDE
jgi:hypothetical protein